MSFIQTLLKKRYFISKCRNCMSKSTARYKASYEGDGKTQVRILNDDPDSSLMINAYSQVGFRLNNEITVVGPLAIFPRTVFAWNVAHINDITEDSLSIFHVLEPKLDILILGTGDPTNDTTLFQTVIKFGRKHKIATEILSTDQAISTFNFLSSEGRYVAGAMIPPTIINFKDDDVVESKLRHNKLYDVQYED